MKHVQVETENGTLDLSYGVTVTKHGDVDFYGVFVSDGAERREVNDVTADRGRIERVLAMLRDGAVTPATVYDVVSDLME